MPSETPILCLVIPIAELVAPTDPRQPLPFYRQDPIPRTGKRRSRISWFWRTPRTQATRRASQLRYDEAELAQAAQKLKLRALSNLPDDRGEQPRSSHRNKSWKRHRAFQERARVIFR